MSVVVNGMKMPTECARFEDGEFVHCPFVNTDDDCILQNKIQGTWEEMYQGCPLIALPDKHGRLVDADALRESVLKWLPHDPCGVEENEHPYETDICVSMLMEIEDAPTIVDLEGENANHN